MNYKKCYKSQKESAAKRGIDWQFENFAEWLEWWGNDIKLRGRGRGKLVMARRDDVGPYHPDNVFKCLHEDNVRAVDRSKSNEKRSNTLKGRVFSEEHKNKISESNKNKTLSDLTKSKISNSLKGRDAPNKGKKMSPEFCQQKKDWWANQKNLKIGELNG